MSRASVLVRVGLAGSLVLGWAPVVAAADRPAPPIAGADRAAPVPPREPTQVVLFDRQTRTSTVVSRDLSGAPGAATSSRPSLSADGGVVAFQSDAGLVPTDTDGLTDVYLWDRAFGQVQLVSGRPGGGGSNGASRNPSITTDATVIAFTSTSTNLTDDDGLSSRNAQVFTWHRLTGALTLASVATGGRPASGNSGDPMISGDGRVVAFESTAANLVEGDTNEVRDVFLRDLARGVTIRASVRTDGRQVGSESRRPSISGDGGSVVFDTIVAGLVPNDTNGARDVFVRDLPPAVTVSPNPLDFGVVQLGTPSTLGVTVVSHGWTPVHMTGSAISGLNAGDFVVAGDSCTGLSLPYGATCTIAVLDVPAEAGPRSATLEVLDTALDSPQLVSLLGGVPGPELRLEPAVGPPGFVAVLTGTNLPPGAEVVVAWDRGITQPLAPVVVGPDGTVQIQVLVFHHDQVGPRQLLVTPGGGGPSFTVAPLQFLVVSPPLQPPGGGAITFLAPGLEQILTRR